MSQIDKTKYQDFVSALSQRFGSKYVLAGHGGMLPTPAPKTERDIRRQRLSDQLALLLKQEIKLGEVMIKDTREGVSINLLEALLFETGKADIRPEADKTLNEISTYLVSLPNMIRVEGHTDNVPIHTVQFPSNWHLSVARAMNTGYYIILQGIPPQRISIAGYSEYQPVAPNDTPENRLKNRRVEIVILLQEPRSLEASALNDSL
jgi:chemotaxis protein MotB